MDWLRGRDQLVHSSAGKEAVVIAGAGPLARVLAKALAPARPVTLIDSNSNNIRAAKALNLNALQGDALDDSVLRDAGIEEAGLFIGLTPNAAVNVLTAKRAHEAFMVAEVRSVLTSEDDGGLFQQLERIGAQPLFPYPVDLNKWVDKLHNQQAEALFHELSSQESTAGLNFEPNQRLPLMVEREGVSMLLNKVSDLKMGDQVLFVQVV